jgi:hypothetical protein
MNKIVAFTDLHVWQEGHKLVIGVYENTKKFPKEETYSMINQMRRAASSVTANIAEGFGRHTYPDKINFYYMAQGPDFKNGIYQHDPMFQTGWGQGWFACVIFAGTYVNYNSMKFSPLD